MTPLYYDLHLHSCLSPCGDDDMTPANIVGMASLKGLNVIALTDHNSCRNCPAAMFHGNNYGVIVIPGMELCTAEEVHVICLFPTLEQALAFDTYVYEHMLPILNKPEIFGKQEIINEADERIGIVDNLLINATDISFEKAFPLVTSFGGIAYPAHVDKSTTSLLSNLGFVPPDSVFTCAEFQNLKNLHVISKTHSYFRGCNILSNSDAHYLEDIHEPVCQLFPDTNSISDILTAITKKL